MKNVLLFLFIFTFLMNGNAQTNLGTQYSTSLGVKLYPGAITAKHFIANNKAVEGLGYFNADGFRFTGLYELHYPISSIEGLKWYVGGGGHLGIWSDTWKTSHPTRNAGLAIGVDGVLGLDYKIKAAPLNLSLDWQPSFNLIGYSYFEGGWGGLSIRYAF